MPYYKALRSWAVYKDELRTAIHQLKYRGNMTLGQALATPIITQLQELQWPIDMVTPMPLGLARLAVRGYNQASLLAKPIALHFQLPYQTHASKGGNEERLRFASRKENGRGIHGGPENQRKRFWSSTMWRHLDRDERLCNGIV
jgi:predicted amidophosphoribosyltransferase